METIDLQFPSEPAAAAQKASMCGVVGSGNLEILIQPSQDKSRCTLRIKTSARGFGKIWWAVAADFTSCHAAGGTKIDINDMGATPAVVILRLGQALREFIGDPK
jgi:malonate decarboxylase delta subunit